MNVQPIPFYLYNNRDGYGRLCEFDSQAIPRRVRVVKPFNRLYDPTDVAIAPQMAYAIYGGEIRSFEIVYHGTGAKTADNSLQNWHKGAAVAYYKYKLYYIGSNGKNGNNQTSPAWAYDGVAWNEQVPANAAIEEHSHSAVAHEGYLYVLDLYETRKIVRLYPDENRWSSKIGNTMINRCGAAIASLNDKIYITGGCNEDGTEVLNSCETFEALVQGDAEELENSENLNNEPNMILREQNVRIGEMTRRRCYHSLVVANNRLYVIGGYERIINPRPDVFYLEQFCPVIEEFDPDQNTWTPVGEFPEPPDVENP